MKNSTVTLQQGRSVKLMQNKYNLKVPFKRKADREINGTSPPRARREGANDAQRMLIAEKKLNGEMFDDVVKRSNTVLYKTSSVFPFDLFPNELIVDVTKATVIDRSFFMSGVTQSVYMRDILDVMVETGPFFATLHIVDLGFTQNKLSLHYLTKKDAFRAREIIEGLVAANKAGVDLTKIGRQEIIDRLPDLVKAQRTPHP